jgi:hypothetical protein
MLFAPPPCVSSLDGEGEGSLKHCITTFILGTPDYSIAKCNLQVQ